ncbi:MAG: hypothetical protein EOO61_23010 [Hymenobacter sp.]|nr:MAG: hypothetical protein EOO61_23010 [Hymenobacter sp.]
MKTQALFAILLTLVGCQQQSDASHSTANNIEAAARIDGKQANAPVKTNNIVFDIPALLPLTLAQVKAKLGKPVEELQANVTNTERSLIYKKHGLILSIDYFADSPKIEVIGFMNKRDTISFDYLLPLGNLELSDSGYVIDTIRGERPNTYRGIAVRLDTI